MSFVRCVNHNDTEYKDVQTVRRHLKRWGPFNQPQQVLDSMLQKKQKLDMSDHNDIPQDNVLDVDADDNASDHEDEQDLNPVEDSTANKATRDLSRSLLKSVVTKKATQVGVVDICKAFRRSIPEESIPMSEGKAILSKLTYTHTDTHIFILISTLTYTTQLYIQIYIRNYNTYTQPSQRRSTR